ncbi:MAG: biotin--[acetyl-CoA-carboxylase] ligase [Coriobacteriales bacterium]|jgi:BirA family biotin operon repressor/biotin-[acetyl-CoA-carboxylase] ligase
MSTKNDILAFFERNRGVEVSGQELAEQLGVSRNSVWKAIVSLRDDGYEIDAGTNRGYVFSPSNDVLSAEGIAAALPADVASALDIRVHDEVDSTNNEAKRLLSGGLHGPALVVAARQSAGRGRRGREFASPEGGVYLTLVLPGAAAADDATFVTMAAAVAVARAIEACSSCEPRIKWVNDVFVDGLKVCGILTEGSTDLETGTIDNVVVGIGVDTAPEALPAELEGIAGAIVLDPGCGRNDLIAAIVAGLLALDPLGAGAADRTALVEEYRARSLVIGKSIEYEERGIICYGRAVDIDGAGGLVVEREDGKSVTLRGGEVTLRLDR